MSARALRPWTDFVKLHPDVKAGALTEAVFAIDLGAIAAGAPNVPVVNRDPEAFFRATYLTADLQKLMEKVLGSLDGIPEGKGFAYPENVALLAEIDKLAARVDQLREPVTGQSFRGLAAERSNGKTDWQGKSSTVEPRNAQRP